jgi:hypothetical protein
MYVGWVVLAVSVFAVGRSLMAALGLYLQARIDRALDLNPRDAKQAEQVIRAFLARHSTGSSEVVK